MRHSGRILSLVVFAAACAGRAGEPQKGLAEYRAQWAEERRALDEGLDQLEERLLTDQARVRFWVEMRERHQSATAVACNVLGGHAEAIASYLDQQRLKTATLAKRNRVAANFVRAADVR